MRDCFDRAYESFCNSFLPLAECMAESAKIIIVYATLPLWIVPYAIFKKHKSK